VPLLVHTVGDLPQVLALPATLLYRGRCCVRGGCRLADGCRRAGGSVRARERAQREEHACEHRGNDDPKLGPEHALAYAHSHGIPTELPTAIEAALKDHTNRC
jgi:hypothetical protein